MLIYVHPLGWSALTPGKEELSSAHRSPCLSFCEPSPALCRGRHWKHLIAPVLLSFALLKEGKALHYQHTCLSASTTAQSSPASGTAPATGCHFRAWTLSTMLISGSKVIKTLFYHTQQCIISMFFNLCFSVGELCALKSAMPFFFFPLLPTMGKDFQQPLATAIFTSHFNKL